MSKKKVGIDELKFGMYVSELDRPWTETPFRFQGFILRHDRQLETLRQHCKHVYVDPDKSDQAIRDAFAARELVGKTGYPERVSVENEMASATREYEECEQVLLTTFATVRSDAALDGEQLKASVGAVVDSVVRNADAMLLLTRLRQKGDYELKRALEASVLMITFGRFLQLERGDLGLLGLAGLLQDIGKLRVPDEILKKPGSLTLEELKLARMHVVHSGELLKPVAGLPPMVRKIALLHHERHDGGGYPLGRAGADIGMHGAMAAIVDTFSALTALRPYAAQMSPSNALGLLYKGRGKSYHDALVEQFIQCIGIYPVGSVVELNSGEIAIVIAQNRVRRLQPRVMVVLDRDWKPLRPQKMLDLVKEPKASPTEPYRIQRTLEAERLPLDPRDFFL